ncbi:hypothetical protein SAMN06264364_12187 [Quadrisphaera granulorum]|uniref:Uncharacterized protein n=1 Tax=Quadrisphaera granulorum TaxID=317664 RepID=A0A316A2L4_9ACTN|nr:HGxxPAAW family protein [Quadrisphaera granulorum]PWJ51210.1 hypothetical protein BXY45_12187 [Quadrisphaera granulorum]SZE97860.1 hypothetical protein SAMN06264364_12187 [Quadrisphaera granulorum]
MSTDADSNPIVQARREEVEQHIDHGHSVTGWTGAGLGLLGSAIASVAMVLAMVWLFWVGIVVMLLGLPFLVMAGKGKKKQHSQQHGKPTPVR